jgi:uncharacterized protein YwbE
VIALRLASGLGVTQSLAIKPMSGLKKGTRVELVSHTDRREKFSVEEAENILTNPNNHGHWVLPPHSKYKLTDGKIISTGSTGTPPQG